jgi:uridine kinase
VSPPVTTAAIDAVLLFDGVFLLRTELFNRWDLRIFVSATFGRALERSRLRDQTSLMSAGEAWEIRAPGSGAYSVSPRAAGES